MPEFQVNGAFDNNRYLAIINQAGFFQSSNFRDYLRVEMTRRQLSQALVATEFNLPYQETLQQDLQNQTRNIRFATVSAKQFEADVDVSEEEIKTYYQTNQVRFENKEKVKVNFIRLNVDDIAKQSFATISQYIRGSATLEAKQFIETTNNRCFVADRDAIGYVSNSQSQFERVMLCLALAVAYRSVIHDFMNKVTQATNSENIDQLLVLYRQILSFNAGNYFRYPVDLNSHELRIIWDTIHKNWCLQELNQELTNQLTAVAELLRAEQDRKDAETKEDLAKLESANAEQQAKRENSFNRKATIAGVFLGVLSVLALVELTPQHFTSAYTNWLQPIVNTVVTTSQAETKK